MRPWLSLVLALTLCAPLSAEAAKKKRKTKPKKKEIAIEVPLIQIPNSPFFLVETHLGDYGKVRMLVDTGASETVLADWVIQEKDIPLAPDEADSDHPGLKKAKVEELRVGKKTKILKYINTVPSPTAFKTLRIGGIFNPQKFFVGQDVFLDFPLKRIVAGEIDKKIQKKRKLLATTPLRACSINMESKLVADANLNGNPTSLNISTGEGKSTIRSEVAGHFDNKDELSFAPAQSETKLSSLEDAKLSLGKINTQLNLAIAPLTNCPRADGRLGNDFLKQFGVMVSAERDEMKLYQ